MSLRRMPIVLHGDCDFPPAALAPRHGPLAIGGDLSPARLLRAYRAGIFPWYSEGEPICWHSPDPRAGIPVQDFHVPRRLARTIAARRFRLAVNCDFAAVIRACAETPRPGQDGTWITGEMIEAYIELHRLGAAHCVAAWQDGELAGGIYGVAVGGVFSGESMFHRRTDASKAALVGLLSLLRRGGAILLDAQQYSRHLEQFGGGLVRRRDFLALLDAVGDRPQPPGLWTPNEDFRP